MHRAAAVAASFETILPMSVRSPSLVSKLKQMRPDILCQDRARTLRHPPSTQRSCQESSQLGLGHCVRAAIMNKGKLVFRGRWT